MPYITDEYNLGLENVAMLSSFTVIDYHFFSNIVRTNIDFFHTRIQKYFHYKVSDVAENKVKFASKTLGDVKTPFSPKAGPTM